MARRKKNWQRPNATGVAMWAGLGLVGGVVATALASKYVKSRGEKGEAAGVGDTLLVGGATGAAALGLLAVLGGVQGKIGK